MEEPALPVPDPGQSNPETGLLPESGELPARLPPQVPSKLLPEGASPEAASKNSGTIRRDSVFGNEQPPGCLPAEACET